MKHVKSINKIEKSYDFQKENQESDNLQGNLL